MKLAILASALATATAFAPAQQAATSTTALAAFEGELGAQAPLGFFDPLGLVSDGDQEKFDRLRGVEIKHGRICMLAIVGMLVQESGIHFSGAAYENTDIFGAIKSVGWGVNIQVFLTIGIIEASNFYKHYDDETVPGNIEWGSNVLTDLSPKDQLWRQEQEVVHGRLAMIAFIGALVQTLIFEKPLLAL